MNFSSDDIISTLLVLLLYAGFVYALAKNWNLAWHNPKKLKTMTTSGFEKMPTWIPFREIFLWYYNSDAYIWITRVSLIFGLLIALLASIMGLVIFLKIVGS
jgi:hypothetical protein